MKYTRERWWLQWVIALALALATLVALLPINGKVSITMGSVPATDAWPRFGIERSTENGVRQSWVSVYDIRPWSHVMLTATGNPLARDETWTAGSGPWQWRWLVPDESILAEGLVFYHSCATGCRERGRADFSHTESSVASPAEQQLEATKLGLVFPSLERDWHGRSGWAVDLTYVMHQEDKDFSIDGLAKRVASHIDRGLRVIVRVSYAREQSLPPVGDEVALRDYLDYSKRLARDERLRDVFAFAVGNGLNNPLESRLSERGPLTPTWYARLFNGFSLPVSRHDNVVEIMRAERPTVRVLVGSVTPWLDELDGELPSPLAQPWLNFFHTTLSYIAASAEAKSIAGLPNIAPDGFALHAAGRLDATTALSPDQEPFTDQYHPGWGRAQAGFRVYKDWLATINDHPTLQGLPVYIITTNTYIFDGSELPAQNYAPGWLTNALAEANANEQVHAICWFLDDPLGGLWTEFSLQHPVGRMHDAAAEFDQLLR